MNPLQPEALQLRDIHLPPPVDFWPPAPGWWLLMVLLLGLLGWGGMFAWRRWHIRRQRRTILGLLEQLENTTASTPVPEFLARLSSLLKRIALLRHPRHLVAPLTGRDWLRFLDETGGDGGFSNGPGQVLAAGPYLRDLYTSVDRQALGELIRSWIRKNTDDRDAQ